MATAASVVIKSALGVGAYENLTPGQKVIAYGLVTPGSDYDETGGGDPLSVDTINDALAGAGFDGAFDSIDLIQCGTPLVSVPYAAVYLTSTSKFQYFVCSTGAELVDEGNISAGVFPVTIVGDRDVS